LGLIFLLVNLRASVQIFSTVQLVVEKNGANFAVVFDVVL